MKFNKELQEKIDRECIPELQDDPYVLTEYQNTFGDYEMRNDIYKVVIASHAIGLDLSPLQAFQLWGCLSASWGCSGWMTVGVDPGKNVSMLEEAISTYFLTSKKSDVE